VQRPQNRPKFLRPQNNPKIKAGWFGRATPAKQIKIGSGVQRPQNKLKLVRACNARKTVLRAKYFGRATPSKPPEVLAPAKLF